jgi:hypothetical protein
MSERRFPPPWSVKEQDACYVVRDRGGQALASVYFEKNKAAGRAALSLSARTSLAQVTRDDAAVSIIARHACPACPLSGTSSVGRSQDRKGGAEDDCSGKCDLCHVGHCTISFVCSAAGAATAHPIRSTNDLVIPGRIFVYLGTRFFTVTNGTSACNLAVIISRHFHCEILAMSAL